MTNPKALILRVVSYNLHSLKRAVVKKIEQIMREVGEHKF